MLELTINKNFDEKYIINQIEDYILSSKQEYMSAIIYYTDDISYEKLYELQKQIISNYKVVVIYRNNKVNKDDKKVVLYTSCNDLTMYSNVSIKILNDFKGNIILDNINQDLYIKHVVSANIVIKDKIILIEDIENYSLSKNTK